MSEERNEVQRETVTLMKIEELGKWLDEKKEVYCRISDRIWELAELQYREKGSASLQAEYLKKQGFSVRTDLAGMETAFVAEWGEGAPVVAILGEYDALDGLSQQAGATECIPIKENGPGHGCGHNLLGTAGVAAAEAVKEYLERNGKKGTVRYYGCPAEEGGAGKTFMVREGCFDGVDAAFTWHPSYQNVMFTTGTLANFQVKFKFKGISSHAAASPHMGRSALDALELMNVGVNFLREHIVPEARIHYAIVNTGGTAPNVVQAEAEAIYLVRAPHLEQTREIFDRVVRIAKGAAQMTDTEMEMEFQTGVSDYIPNGVLTGLAEECFRHFLPMRGISEENKSYMKALREKMPFCPIPEEKEEADFILENGYCGGLLPQDGSSAHASTDVGDVSWVVPTAQFETACYAYGTPSHSWQRTAQGKTEIAYEGMMTAAKVMAMAACRLLEEPLLLEDARKEHEQNRGGVKYMSPIPDDVVPQI